MTDSYKDGLVRKMRCLARESNCCIISAKGGHLDLGSDEEVHGYGVRLLDFIC